MNPLVSVDEISSDFIEKCRNDNRMITIRAENLEALIEAADLCRKMDFHSIALSIDAPHPLLFIEANRNLFLSMRKLGWEYPIYLAHSNASKIASAIGIGTLLLNGIGDTFSFSFGKKSAERLKDFAMAKQTTSESTYFHEPKTPLFERHRPCMLLMTVTEGDLQRPDFFRMIGCSVHLGRPKMDEEALNYAVLLDLPKERTSFDVLNRLQETGVGIISPHPIAGAVQLLTLSQAILLKKNKRKEPIALLMGQERPKDWEEVSSIQPSLIIFRPLKNLLEEGRAFFQWMHERDLDIPVILHVKHAMGYEAASIQASAEYGALLSEGMGDGIWMDAPFGLESRRELGFDILNALQGASLEVTV